MSYFIKKFPRIITRQEAFPLHFANDLQHDAWEYGLLYLKDGVIYPVNLFHTYSEAREGLIYKRLINRAPMLNNRMDHPSWAKLMDLFCK